jgi:hypothetical protein
MHPSEIRSRRILISPLNWGFGHLSRCIPLIYQLTKNENKLYFVGDQKQISIVRQYFPTIVCIQFQGYPFHFKANKSFRLNLMRQLPLHLKRWREELTQVDDLCKKYNIEVVISDHRYGFRSIRACSVFVTHQINLPLRWYEFFVQSLHRKWMKKFDEVWIVDDEILNHAGALSKASGQIDAIYIGTLSRFILYGDEPSKRNGGVVIVVSGPLQHAANFAMEQSKIYGNDAVTMILPSELGGLMLGSNIHVVFSDDWIQCDKIILNADKIVSRSGYSTLMDIHQLRVPFIITPTPGQSEQEYLANYWTKRNNSHHFGFHE